MANREEPKTAPQPDRWYTLTLGPSFKDDATNKYCTLRYEFKPASIDKTKAGTMHKNKENRVSVEFQNNQLGKPKVTFEGSSEDYKENDAVLFFDGQTLRLERLHRAVKQLRHLRLPGESAASSASASAYAAAGGSQSAQGSEQPPRSSPVGKGAKAPPPAPPQIGRSTFPPVPVEVERIDVGEPPIPGNKSAGRGITAHPADPPNVSTSPPSPKNDEGEEHQDIDIEELFGAVSPDDRNTADEKVGGGFDTNTTHQNDSDEEIADVDDSGDEADKGRNAAEALKAQVDAEEREEQTSSSSSSSGSGSSDSVSGSGSSSSSDSDEDSVNSI